MRTFLVALAGALLLGATAVAQQAAPPTGGAQGAGRPAAPPRDPFIPEASLLLPYKIVAEPRIPGEDYGGVAGIATNSKGHLYIFQRKDPALVEFDQNGKFVRNFGPGMQTRAHSVRIDAQDNIWLVDDGGHTVTKLSPEGKVLQTLGVKGQPGSWDEAKGARQFNQPTDLGFGKNGDIFVSTGHGGTDPRIVHFDKTGKFINTWTLQHDDGSRANIHTMIVAPDGNIYAADREVMKIRVFTPEGKHVKDLQMKNLVCGLYVDRKGGLWMTAGHDGMVMSLDWNGKITSWTGKAGTGPNEYGEAHYMTLSNDLSTIYVSDTINRRIQKLVR